MVNMRFKVGDRVKIKNNDFFNKNKGKLPFYVDSMALCFANEIVTIKSYGRYPNTYRIDEDEGDFLWTDEMIEGLVEEENEKKLSDESWRYKNIFDRSQYHNHFECPEGYIFKDEKGNVINTTKIVLEKKKKEYPKTYDECCKVLGYDDREIYCIFHTGADEILFEALYCLKVCRDAYLKIAGEEMGLGKPWDSKYGCGEWGYWIGYDINENKIYCQDSRILLNRLLVFPTEEMRDAFKENFGPDIEICKEFL